MRYAKRWISILLVLAVLPLMLRMPPEAKSQSLTTITNLITVTTPTSVTKKSTFQSTSIETYTTTLTSTSLLSKPYVIVNEGVVAVEAVGPGRGPGDCNGEIRTLSAQKGDILALNLTAPTEFTVYVMNDETYTTWRQTGKCNPGIISESLLAFAFSVTSFVDNIVIPKSGQYHIAFLNFSTSSSVNIRFSAKITGVATPSTVTTTTDHIVEQRSTTTFPATMTIIQTSSSPQTQVGTFAGQETLMLGTGVAVVLVAFISTVLLLRRRKSVQVTAVPTLAPVAKQRTPAFEQSLPSQGGISTGYDDLDNLLGGGLPKGYSVVFVSPPCDEIELLLQRIIESCIESGVSTFYVSRDTSKARELAESHQKDFYAVYTQLGGKLAGPPNLYQIPGTDNLNELNISLARTILNTRKANGNNLIIVDIVSDVLLRHKALVTRRWLSDFVTKRKAESFTVLAILDPYISPKEEAQTVIGLFDGVISIHEKEISERSRRFLVIKKMHGRLYSENELMLEKEKLFRSRRAV